MIPDHYKPLKTKRWLNQLSEEDRKAFARIGYNSLLTGENSRGRVININQQGGIMRAITAKRDRRGRFIK